MAEKSGARSSLARPWPWASQVKQQRKTDRSTSLIIIQNFPGGLKINEYNGAWFLIFALSKILPEVPDSIGSLARLLFFAGLGLIVLSGAVFLFSKLPFGGKLPGDILVKKEGFTFYFPLATSILLSLLLSLGFYLYHKWSSGK